MGLFGGAKKSGYWKHESHLFGGDSFECSVCGSKFRKIAKECPKCGSRMKKSKYDPKWVDELEFYDAVFDD